MIQFKAANLIPQKKEHTMTIYKSAAGKEEILKLYDSQLVHLDAAHFDKYISNNFHFIRQLSSADERFAPAF